MLLQVVLRAAAMTSILMIVTAISACGGQDAVSGGMNATASTAASVGVAAVGSSSGVPTADTATFAVGTGVDDVPASTASDEATTMPVDPNGEDFYAGPFKGASAVADMSIAREIAGISIDVPAVVGRQEAWLATANPERHIAVLLRLKTNLVAVVAAQPAAADAIAGLRDIVKTCACGREVSVNGFSGVIYRDSGGNMSVEWIQKDLDLSLSASALDDAAAMEAASAVSLATDTGRSG